MRTVNVRDYGGIQKAIEAGVRYCGRPSVLGNPCSEPNKPCPICKSTHFGPRMKQLDAGRSIGCYTIWLWRQIQAKNPKVMEALKSFHGRDLLGCWCSPKTCHCDVIARAWVWCRNSGLL